MILLWRPSNWMSCDGGFRSALKLVTNQAERVEARLAVFDAETSACFVHYYERLDNTEETDAIPPDDHQVPFFLSFFRSTCIQSHP